MSTRRLDIERIRYMQGQKLRSADFRDQAEIEGELRWWHNRALHRSFGVSEGLWVAPQTEGSLDPLRVGGGVAYDCYGREIRLERDRNVHAPGGKPAEAGKLVLLLRLKTDPVNRDDREGLLGCGRLGGDDVELVWKPLAGVEVEDGVPLALLNYESSTRIEEWTHGAAIPDSFRTRLRFDAAGKLLIFRGVMSDQDRDALLEVLPEMLSGAINDLFDESQKVPVLEAAEGRRIARPLARPRIGRGITVPGGTAWEVWIEQVRYFGNINNEPFRVVTNRPLGVQVDIDTSAAGFTATPCYFAMLHGVPANKESHSALWGETNTAFFPVPSDHVHQPSALGFTFRLWLPPILRLAGLHKGPNNQFFTRLSNQNFATEFINFARRNRLYVSWLGIQHAMDAGGPS